MKLALSEFKVEGVATTIPFHLAQLEDPKFINAETYTTYIESEFMKSFVANAPKTGTFSGDRRRHRHGDIGCCSHIHLTTVMAQLRLKKLDRTTLKWK